MPANIVKTPADESKWSRAKKIVKEEYPGAKTKNPDKYYAITTSIFKNMKEGSMQKSSSYNQGVADALSMYKVANIFSRAWNAIRPSQTGFSADADQYFNRISGPSMPFNKQPIQSQMIAPANHPNPNMIATNTVSGKPQQQSKNYFDTGVRQGLGPSNRTQQYLERVGAGR